MSLYSRHGLTHRLTTYAAAAVFGLFTLAGLHAPSALDRDPEVEPCLDLVSLDHFTASRTTIAAGQSATLSWEVVEIPNTGCLSQVELQLETNRVRSPVNKVSTRSVSPAFTTTYRLYLLDPFQSPPDDTYLGNPITITVLQPPPPPPADCS